MQADPRPVAAPGPDGGQAVIQVVRELNPNGGVGGVVFELKTALDARAIPNSVLTLEAVTGGKPRPRRPDSKLQLLQDVVLFSVLGSRAIARAKQRNPRCLIINHADPLGGDIFVDHGLHKAMVMDRPGVLLRNPIHLFLLIREEIRHRARRYKAVVCLSEQGVETLRRHFPSTRTAQVVAIPNGIALDRFVPDPAKLVPRGTEEPFDLLFVGHEFERKGLPLILEALPQLPDGVRLTVVGGGEALIRKEQARAQGLGVAGRVRFLGRRTDVPDIMRASDLLLLPSIAEAWPLVALEAMASGTPVLMTPVAAGPEIVGDGLGGLLIERTAADIAAKVMALHADPVRFLKLRQGAIEKARRYPWSAIAERYLALGRELRAT
jgi:UDP-glucose:(heptosyl)LPS alpha-1,3-glucosyltransferase